MKISKDTRNDYEGLESRIEFLPHSFKPLKGIMSYESVRDLVPREALQEAVAVVEREIEQLTTWVKSLKETLE